MGGEMTLDVRSQRMREVAEGQVKAPKGDLQPSLPILGKPEVASIASQPERGRQVERPAADDRTNVTMRQLGSTYAKFTVQDGTHRVSVEIIDAASGEVVRTIPPWHPTEATAALDLTLTGIRGNPGDALHAHPLVTAQAVQRLTKS